MLNQSQSSFMSPQIRKKDIILKDFLVSPKQPFYKIDKKKQ